MEANKHRVFGRFLLSYLLILIIPLALGGLVLTEAERIVRAYATETSQSILEQTRDILDARTAELRRMATLMALSPRVRSLAEEEGPISSATRYAIWEMTRELRPYQLTESFLPTFFLYCREIEMIISPYTASPVSTFYGYSLQYGDMTAAQFEEVVFARYYAGEFLPVTAINYEGNNFSIIPYVQTLPIGQRERLNATLIMLIDEAQIRKLLEPVKVYDQGWVYVEDQEGRVVTSVVGARAKVRRIIGRPGDGSSEAKIAGLSMNVVQTTSAYNGWRYVAVLPSAAVMGRVRYVRNLAAGLGFAAFLIGLLAAYYLAYRNVKPLREIVHSLTGLFGDGIDKGGTEYEVLRGTVTAINTVITDNKFLHHAVERQRPLLKAAVMDSLLKGRYHDDTEVQNELAHVGWEIKGRHYLVMIIRIAHLTLAVDSIPLKELDYIRAFIESHLMPTALSETYLHQVDRGSFAVLISPGADNPAGAMEGLGPQVKVLADLMFRTCGVRIQCALGGLCDSLLRVCHSYDQARQAADYQTIKQESDIVWYNALPSENVRYYYPMQLEERLIYLASIGQEQEIRKILADVYAENIDRRELSTEMAQQLLYELRGTADKVMTDGNIDERREKCRLKLLDSTNVDQFFKTISELFAITCDLTTNKAKNGLRNLVQGVLGHIKINYKDPELSLTTVAVHFGVSPAYLSQLFKEETGENFSDCLESVRMERAGQLLADPRLSVSDIACQLGYNSDKVFRRAFKRVKGTSPTDYRKAILPPGA